VRFGYGISRKCRYEAKAPIDGLTHYGEILTQSDRDASSIATPPFALKLSAEWIKPATKQRR
jgi:hypothetical protein